MEKPMIFAVVMIIAGLLSWGLTGLVRRYTLRRGILDIPNARSSHLVATPRGGGLAMVVVFLASLLLLALQGAIGAKTAVALIGGGLLVAGIGWLDDRRGLPPLPRAVVQGLAALWALGWLGGLPSLDLGVTRLFLGPVGFLLGLLGIVWCINLYNFMDGIDGLAGVEAVTVAGTAALLLVGKKAGFFPATGVPAATAGMAIVCGLLVPAAAGFLAWNWPPARLFMGFTFGVLAVASENSGALPLLVWMLLLGVFVVDATATLLRRIRRGERWTEAHRTHAYQLAVQTGRTHKQVTLAVLGINLLLGLAAAAACLWPRALLLVVGLSGAVLVLLWARVAAAYEAYRRARAQEGAKEAAAASPSPGPG